MTEQKGMLLVLHSPLRAKDGQLLWDAQACNGAEQWADNFGSVIVAAPLIPDVFADQDKVRIWRDVTTLQQPDRFEFVPLPWAYSLPKFLTSYRSTRSQLAGLIQRCHYLQFAIGGLIGDWAAIAALEAQKQQRDYAVHADRVEHEVVRQVARDADQREKIKAAIVSPLMAQLERRVIRQCNLGLWHGEDCYAAYSSLCHNNYVIHDVHTKPEDAIPVAQLAEKVAQAATAPTLRICYAGRIAPMKAPLEWVRAIGVAKDLGVNLQATWIGDGEQFDEMASLINRLNLGSYITLHGLERDRSVLLQKIRDSHLMLFTHITPESPRCLIEALVSGTPIVGYESRYVHELTDHNGGGAFVPVHDWQQLGALIYALSSDRPRLAQLIQDAGTNGARFNDQAVFHERSELLKKHLF
jgi:glycosyltransferase involved in cell wall biosynthesis